MSSFLKKISSATSSLNLDVFKNLKLYRKKPHINWQFTDSTQRKKIVILGSGWGGYSIINKINRKLYDVTVVSPRNHFLFTPLLASTTVGTLEFRAITEPVRHIRDVKYHQAKCVDIDTNNNIIKCRDSFDRENIYDLKYDVLVYSVGAIANDFGIKGVSEHAFFLKQVRDAQNIRNKIEELFERASKPNVSRAEREQLLSFVVVGGGPTSIEWTAELHDWLMEDGARMFPELLDHVSISLIEATNRILGAFNVQLADYTLKKFRKRKIKIMTSTRVINIDDKHVELQDGYKLPYGMCVWATGNQCVPLTDRLSWKKTKQGRIIVDSHLRIQNIPNVFAIGDCAEFVEKPLPQTAQVAKQQGFYVANILNDLLLNPPDEWDQQFKSYSKTFAYAHQGTMAYIGGWTGVVDFSDKKDNKSVQESKWFANMKGIRAWLFWRSAYFTMLRSAPNQVLVPMYWFKTWVFGRDFSRF